MKKIIFENWQKFLREDTRDTYDSEVSDASEDSRDDGMKKMQLTEKDDRCTRIAKRKYDVWPSAYASGAVVKCRQGKIWKDLKEDDDLSMNEEYEDLIEQIVQQVLSEMVEAKKKPVLNPPRKAHCVTGLVAKVHPAKRVGG